MDSTLLSLRDHARNAPHELACARCLTRRDMLRLLSLAMVSSCGAPTASERAPDTSGNDAGIVVTSDEVRIDLAAQPGLDAPGGWLVIGEANVIVLQVAPAAFRAFDNRCTHAGCGIFLVRNARMECGCHGSVFDSDGTNVAGPAPTPLRRLALTYEVAARQVRVRRGSAAV